MKKLLAIAIIAVMTLGLFAVAANAADPAVIVTADQLKELADGAEAVGGLTYEVKEDGGEKFIEFTSSNNDPWVVFKDALNVGKDNKFAVIKYKTSDSGVQTIDFYLQVAEPHAKGDTITADGEWHTTVLNLETPFPDTMTTLWDGTIKRFDVMNGNVEGAKLDIAFVAFFAAEADAKAYTGPAAASNVSVMQSWFDNVNTTGPSIQLRGWAIIDGDEIDDMGYRVDDNTPVLGFLEERSAEIVSVMGSDLAKTNGFNVTFSTDDLSAGEHTVHVVVKTKGGAFLDINKDDQDGFKVVGTGSAGDNPSENPGTADASVIAIAAVACIALAGVVIAKKVK